MTAYAGRLGTVLPGGLPPGVADAAHRSVGSALAVAARLHGSGHISAAQNVHDAAASAFFYGFERAVFLASAVALLGGVIATLMLPSQPPGAAPAIDDAGP